MSFPFMLYRLFGPGEKMDFDDPKNFKIVEDFPSLEKALDEGWLAHPLLKGVAKDAADHDSEEAKLRKEIAAWKNRKSPSRRKV